MRKLGQLWRLVRESHAQPLAGAPSAPPIINDGQTSITFIGHSSFLIQTAGKALLIDPVFATRLIVLRRQRRPGIRIADLPPIDAVLLTHAHMDHLNRPSLRAITREMRRRGLATPVAIVSTGVEDLVQDLGFSRIETLQWWQSAQLGEDSQPASLKPRLIDLAAGNSRHQNASSAAITITATPARHWGARMFNDTHRGFGGYVIASASGPTIYHSGDTAYFNGFTEIGRRLRPEIALLPIGAYFPDSYRSVHTSPEEAFRAFIDLKAEVMIPMHYGTFRLGREPMDEPLPRLLNAASHAGLSHSVEPLTEGQSWTSASSKAVERDGTA
ncbi:MBL fold metallo-hydrolase [Occallatibacter savannae]|uniref:MBL fold metallo-hydrolase n=1 Tax=Occallatibacter savannae TaxID=1002691 RepID=UPI000D68B3F2|nr:MBL fold metallo-hydrolase [Occallatibacter savannae]